MTSSATPPAAGEGLSPARSTNEATPQPHRLPPRASATAAPAFSLPPTPPKLIDALPDVSSEPLPLDEICRIELSNTTEDSLRQARIHHELGALSAEPGEALGHHLRAIELHPHHRPALVNARRLLLDARNIVAALPLFDAELRLVDGAKEQAEILFHKGRAQEELQRDLEAARACYRQAVALVPNLPRYLKALHQVDVCLEDWTAAATTREREQNAVERDVSHRAALLVARATQVESRLEQPGLASELYQRALDVDPEVSGALPSLKRLHHRQERWRDLVAVLEQEASRTADQRVKSSALLQIGQVQSFRLGNRNAAIDALGRAMEVDRSDRLVLESLARLYRDADEAQHLAHVLAHEVDALPGLQDKVVLMFRIANIYDRVLCRNEEARQWYEAGLRLMPTHRPSLAALGALYRRTKSWQSLVVMNLAAAEAEPDATLRARSHVEIADIFEQNMEQPEQAMRHYDLALSFDSSHEGAFKALARLYASHGRYRELIELHQRAIDRVEEPYLREAHYFRVAEVYEFDLGAPAQALAMYKAILKSSPNHLGALHALQRAAESAGAFEELVQALEEEASGSKEPKRTLAICMRAGHVLSERLGLHEQALLRFSRVRQLDADYAPALSAMALTFGLLGRHQDELDVRQEWLRLSDDEREQAVLLYDMAELCESRLGDSDRALGYYRRSVEVDPSFDEAFRALCRQLEERADHGGLVAALRHRLTVAPDAETRARLSYRMAEVHEVHTGQLKLAESCYLAALGESHDLRCAADGLARVRHQLKAWQEQVADLLSDASTINDSRMVIDALLRAGELNRTKLGQLDAAIACFRAVLDEDAGNLAALLALEDCYRLSEAWSNLAVVYDNLSQVLEDESAQTAALAELARLQRHPLGVAPAELQNTLYRILHLDAANGFALRALEQLALEQGDSALLSDVDLRLARLAKDPASAAAHYVRLGRGLLVSDVQGAHDAFKQALECEEDNIGALTGLRSSSERLGDTGSLCVALEGEATWTQDGRRAAALLVASSELHIHAGQRRQAAVDCAKIALRRDPDSRGAADVLVRLMRPEGHADELIELLSGAAGLARSAFCIASLWEQVALLYAEDKGNLVAAIARLTPLYEKSLETVASAQLLGRLYEERQEWVEAVSAYSRAYSLGPNEAQLVAIEFARGRLFAGPLEQPQEAVVCLDRVLAVEGMHPDGLALLLQLRQAAGQVPEALGVAQRLVSIHHEPTARSTILVTFARLQLALNQRAGAAASLREAVGISGALSAAAQEYKRLLGSEEPWDRYTEALRRHLANLEVGRAVGQAKASYLALARVEHEILGNSAGSLHTLRQGLAACQQDLDIHRALAERLYETGQFEAALLERQLMLPQMAADEDTWRGMAQALQGAGRGVEAAVPCAALVVLGQANERELSVARQQRLRPGTARAGSFNDGLLRRLSVFGDLEIEEQIVQVLRAAAPAIEKLWPLDFGAYGLTARDKVPARSDNAMMLRAQALAEAFAIDDFNLYVFGSASCEVVVEVHDGLAFMVPEALLAVSATQQIYALGRAFAAAKHGSFPVFTLGQERVRTLFLAAMRYAQPAAGRDSVGDDELTALHRRLHKALGWRGRGKVESAARACCVAAGSSFEAWVQSVVTVRSRASALITNDLPEVIAFAEHELGEEGVGQGAKPRPLSQQSMALMAFWASKTAFELRTATGIL